MKPGHQLTILQWHHWVQCQQATGSSCSWAAYCLCSSREPTSVTHRERHWPNTAGTSVYDSAGLQSANSDMLLYTRENKRHLLIGFSAGLEITWHLNALWLTVSQSPRNKSPSYLWNQITPSQCFRRADVMLGILDSVFFQGLIIWYPTLKLQCKKDLM